MQRLTRLTWVLTRRALAQICVDPLARAVLASGRIYELVSADGRLVPDIPATPAMSFGSFEAMQVAARAGRLPPGLGALLYDPENWQFTPMSEQLDVGGHVGRALELAQAQGLELIAAPAVTLTKVVPPYRGARRRLSRAFRSPDRYDHYLDAGLAGLAAPADIVVVQAQNAERDSRRYARFVGEAVGQVHDVNRRAIVLAGLSTNPPGDHVTAAALAAAMRAVLHLVDGFWLNVPNPGPHCPTCNEARPDIGIAALRSVFG